MREGEDKGSFRLGRSLSRVNTIITRANINMIDDVKSNDKEILSTRETFNISNTVFNFLFQHKWQSDQYD